LKKYFQNVLCGTGIKKYGLSYTDNQYLRKWWMGICSTYQGVASNADAGYQKKITTTLLNILNGLGVDHIKQTRTRQQPDG